MANSFYFIQEPDENGMFIADDSQTIFYLVEGDGVTYDQFSALYAVVAATSAGGGGGGGGSADFLGLTDTPNSYAGANGKVVAVSGNQLVFQTFTSGDATLRAEVGQVTGQLLTDINSEATTRANADIAEAAARSAADASEAAARAAADALLTPLTTTANLTGALSTSIANEAASRAAADTAETTARVAADTAEAAARAAADALLTPLTTTASLTGALSASIASEATTRAAADSAEAAARAAADALLTPLSTTAALTGSLTASIASEASQRAAADLLLTTLTTTAAISGSLQSQINGIQTWDSQMAFISGAFAYQAVVVSVSGQLSDSINTESIARSDADALLTPLTTTAAISSGLDSRITTNANNIATNTAAIANLQTWETQMAAASGSFATISLVRGISGYLQSEIDAFSAGDVSRSEVANVTAGLNTRLTNVETWDAQLAAVTGNFATVSYVGTVSGNLSTAIAGEASARASADALLTPLTTTANLTGSLQGQISANSANIGTLSSDITNILNATDLLASPIVGTNYEVKPILWFDLPGVGNPFTAQMSSSYDLSYDVLTGELSAGGTQLSKVGHTHPDYEAEIADLYADVENITANYLPVANPGPSGSIILHDIGGSPIELLLSASSGGSKIQALDTAASPATPATLGITAFNINLVTGSLGNQHSISIDNNGNISGIASLNSGGGGSIGTGITPWHDISAQYLVATTQLVVNGTDIGQAVSNIQTFDSQVVGLTGGWAKTTTVAAISAGLDSRITSNTNSISNIQTFDSQVAGLTGTWTPLSTTANLTGSLQSQISTNTTAISNIQTFDSQVAGLTGSFTPLTTTANLTGSLQSQINTNTSNIATNTSSIAALQTFDSQVANLTAGTWVALAGAQTKTGTLTLSGGSGTALILETDNAGQWNTVLRRTDLGSSYDVSIYNDGTVGGGLYSRCRSFTLNDGVHSFVQATSGGLTGTSGFTFGNGKLTANSAGCITSTDDANANGSNFIVNTSTKTSALYGYEVQRSGVTVGGLAIDGSVLANAVTVSAGNAAANITLDGSGNLGARTVYNAGSGSVLNWMIGHNWLTPGALEFVPSSANGGSTYVSPALKLASDSTAIFQEPGTGSGVGGVITSTISGGGNAGYRYRTLGTDRWSTSLIGAVGSEALRIRNEGANSEVMRFNYDGSAVHTGAVNISGATTIAGTTIVNNSSTATPFKMTGDRNGSLAIRAENVSVSGSASTGFVAANAATSVSMLLNGSGQATDANGLVISQLGANPIIIQQNGAETFRHTGAGNIVCTGSENLSGSLTVAGSTVLVGTVNISGQFVHKLKPFVSLQVASQTLPQSSWTKCSFATSGAGISGTADTGSNWDNVNYRFTPPIAGIYNFKGQVAVQVAGSTNYSKIQIWKNGSFMQEGVIGTNTVGGGTRVAWIDADVVVSSTSDYYEIYGFTDSSTGRQIGQDSSSAGNTYFYIEFMGVTN